MNILPQTEAQKFSSVVEKLQCYVTHGLVGWKSKALKSMDNIIDDGQLVSMPFKKSRSDTFLRLTWSSNMRQYLNDKCSRWYFMINGRECSSPASIDGNFYHRIDSPSRPNSNVHRHHTIVGVCKATSSGDLRSASYQISMNVGSCTLHRGGDAYTGWQSTSTMIVEELCPPQWNTLSHFLPDSLQQSAC